MSLQLPPNARKGDIVSLLDKARREISKVRGNYICDE